MSKHAKQLVLVPNAADFVENPGATLTDEQVSKVRRSSEAVLDIVFGMNADTAEKDQVAMNQIAAAATHNYIGAAGLDPEDPITELVAMMRLGTLLLNRAIGTGCKSKTEALLMQANINYLMVAQALEENEGPVADAFNTYIEASTPDFERTKLRIRVVGEGNCPCDAHLAEAGLDAAVVTLNDLPADIRKGLEMMAKLSGQSVEEIFNDINTKLAAGMDPTVAAEDAAEDAAERAFKLLKARDSDDRLGIIDGNREPETQGELDQIIAEIVKQLPADKQALATQKLRATLTLEAIRSGQPVVLEIDLT